MKALFVLISTFCLPLIMIAGPRSKGPSRCALADAKVRSYPQVLQLNPAQKTYVETKLRPHLAEQPQEYTDTVDPKWIAYQLHELAYPDTPTFDFGPIAEAHIGLYSLSSEARRDGLANRPDEEFFAYIGLVTNSYTNRMHRSEVAEALGKAVFETTNLDAFVVKFAEDLLDLHIRLNAGHTLKLREILTRVQKNPIVVDVTKTLNAISRAPDQTSSTMGLIGMASGLDFDFEAVSDLADLAYYIRYVDSLVIQKKASSAQADEKLRGRIHVRGKYRAYDGRNRAIEALKTAIQTCLGIRK